VKNSNKVISFGYNCSIANYLRKNGHISYESCFDNMITKDLTKVIQLINNNGDLWFEDSSLNEKGKKWSVRCNKTGALSIHDVPIQTPREEVVNQLKIAKREQLRSMIDLIKNCTDNITILRSNEQSTTLEETLTFCDSIMKIRKQKIQFFIFQESSSFSFKNINIINTKLPTYEKFWSYNKDWKVILNLILNQHSYKIF